MALREFLKGRDKFWSCSVDGKILGSYYMGLKTLLVKCTIGQLWLTLRRSQAWCYVVKESQVSLTELYIWAVQPSVKYKVPLLQTIYMINFSHHNIITVYFKNDLVNTLVVILYCGRLVPKLDGRSVSGHQKDRLSDYQTFDYPLRLSEDLYGSRIMHVILTQFGSMSDWNNFKTWNNSASMFA